MTQEPRRIVHVTERALFKWCRRHWKYNYKLRLQRKGETSGSALVIGQTIHKALEHYYSQLKLSQEDPERRLPSYDEAKQVAMAFSDELAIAEGYRTWSNQEQDAFSESQKLVLGMLDNYFEFAFQNDSFEVLGTEVRLKYDIPGTLYTLVGTIDLLVRWKKKIWVIDHKTKVSFAQPEALEFDDQMIVYLWLVWKVYGEYPGGAIYNQLIRSFPQPPSLVYNGTQVSKSGGAVASTTRQMYLETIEKNGFDVADYQDILDKLEFKKFMRRDAIARNPAEFQYLDRQIRAELSDMEYCEQEPEMIYPNPTHDCTWSCSFKALCAAESGNGDWRGLAESMFEQHEGRDAAYLEKQIEAEPGKTF